MTSGPHAGTTTSDTQAPDPAVAAVIAGYASDRPAVELGTLLVEATPSAVPVAQARIRLPLATMNRHGLIAGATGTGKTKTLQLMAEQLSAAGVPVFLADVKGDLSGLAAAGVPSERITARLAGTSQQWAPASYPVELLALGGQGTGVPIRASVTSFGPTLMAKVLELNETQTSSLALVFSYADAAGLPLLDLADLRAVVQFLVSAEGKDELTSLGGLSKATAGVILRELTAFAAAGAEPFFGEPEFDTADLLRTSADGRGVISCLELPAVADRLALFSTFLLWLLADLYHDLPEVGDPDKPKLVFFLDEAHLLFTGASKAFLTQVTQTVRLIRSKGVGIFFVTQSPKDVAPDVLAQLGNRVQHALRAYTPDDAKALRAAASTFPKSGYDLEELLTTLGIGEAIVTVLSERGAPTPVAWTRLATPTSLMGPAPEPTLEALVVGSPLHEAYAETVDRDSAYERLSKRLAAPPASPTRGAGGRASKPSVAEKSRPTAASHKPAPSRRRAAHHDEPERGGAAGVVGEVLGSPAFKSFLRSAGTSLGREVTRGLFGTARKRSR